MPLQQKTLAEVLDAVGLKMSPRRDLIEQLFHEEGHLQEMAALLPGLLQLEREGFQKQDFSEQAAFWEVLQAALEGGPAGTPGALLRLLQALFSASGNEGQANREGIPAAFVSRVLAHIRRNPFPRLRTSAVQVLMRLGSPEELGTTPEDYLFGLYSPNAVLACAVFNFIVNGFGRVGIAEAVACLGRGQKPLPPVLWHLAEASCEEHFRALDFKRLFFQLTGRCAGSEKNGGPENAPGTAARGRCGNKRRDVPADSERGEKPCLT